MKLLKTVFSGILLMLVITVVFSESLITSASQDIQVNGRGVIGNISETIPDFPDDGQIEAEDDDAGQVEKDLAYMGEEQKEEDFIYMGEEQTEKDSLYIELTENPEILDREDLSTVPENPSINEQLTEVPQQFDAGDNLDDMTINGYDNEHSAIESYSNSSAVFSGEYNDALFQAAENIDALLQVAENHDNNGNEDTGNLGENWGRIGFFSLLILGGGTGSILCLFLYKRKKTNIIKM